VEFLWAARGLVWPGGQALLFGGFFVEKPRRYVSYHTRHSGCLVLVEDCERSANREGRGGDGFEDNILPLDESLGLNMTKDACVSTVLIIVCESMLAYSGLA
jgi:hypothetical protein